MTESRKEDAKPAPPAPPAREVRRGDAPEDTAADLQRRLVELEKRLQEEKEKVLLSNLRSQEEATYASKVESAIKDVQEKLRRDRRDAEQEENRLKLEAKIRELESRLVQERETWVATLQEQLKARESQDKEVETHFISRIEEMERRWLEEKAHWQKLVMGKDEEIRNLRVQAERLKSIELEAEKLGQEKRFLEEKAQQGPALQAQLQALGERLRTAESDAVRLTQEKRFLEEKVQSVGPLQARVESLQDKEKELFQVRSELAMAKEQAQSLRATAREREERLLSENERLHHEVQSIAGRMRAESDSEVRRFKSELSLASASVQKLRAVAGTLERQRLAMKSQLEQVLRYKKGLEQGHDRAKAELLMMQRKWTENEQRIRQEAEAATRDRVKEDVRRELIDEWRVQEQELRRKAEDAGSATAKLFEDRIQALHEQAESLEAKLKAKTEESVALQERMAQLELARGQLDAEKNALQADHLRLKERWEQAETEKKSELDALMTKHDAAALNWADERERNEKLWKEEQERAQKAIDEARESVQAARQQAAERQSQIDRLEARLADEQSVVEAARRSQGEVDKMRLEEREKAEIRVEQIRQELEAARGEVDSRNAEIERNQAELKRIDGELKSAQNALAEEKARLEQGRKAMKESEFAWTGEKAEFERKIAQLKEQLENFSEVSRINMEAARRELEARVAILEDEIEEYRKPKPGIFQRVLGGGKPRPPKPPKVGPAPAPPPPSLARPAPDDDEDDALAAEAPPPPPLPPSEPPSPAEPAAPAPPKLPDDDLPDNPPTNPL